jgi:hypothetical protein
VYKNRDGKSASKLVNVRCVVAKPRPHWVDIDGLPVGTCSKGLDCLKEVFADKIRLSVVPLTIQSIFFEHFFHAIAKCKIILILSQSKDDVFS